jgi:hypothetical protein
VKAAILCNGESLNRHDLSCITLPVWGLNRSWKVYPNPERQVVLETTHYAANPSWHERMAQEGRLYVVGEWPCGHLLRFAESGTFSRDVFKDGVVTQLHGVGSVFYAALQVAYTLGYREVFALGLDLQGAHFDGTPASPNVARQNAMFVHVPEDLKVWTCGSPESRAVFEKCGFEELCS